MSARINVPPASGQKGAVSSSMYENVPNIDHLQCGFNVRRQPKHSQITNHHTQNSKWEFSIKGSHSSLSFSEPLFLSESTKSHHKASLSSRPRSSSSHSRRRQLQTPLMREKTECYPNASPCARSLEIDLMYISAVLYGIVKVVSYEKGNAL